MNKYEIIIEGHVDKKRFYGFEHITAQHVKDGTTIITGMISDQAMLFAMLGRIRDLGMKLISVRVMEQRIEKEYISEE